MQYRRVPIESLSLFFELASLIGFLSGQNLGGGGHLNLLLQLNLQHTPPQTKYHMNEIRIHDTTISVKAVNLRTDLRMHSEENLLITLTTVQTARPDIDM